MLLRLTALVSGMIFSFGLLLSGMTNPAKIIGFLDIFGAWDPTLALVMLGAILVTLPSFYLLKKRQKTFCQSEFDWPSKTLIDKKLIIGSALFGIGWGLAGFCPGPAIVTLSTGNSSVVLFVASMLVGMALFKLLIKD